LPSRAVWPGLGVMRGKLPGIGLKQRMVAPVMLTAVAQGIVVTGYCRPA
jgi:hypothetical protein